MPVRVLIPTPLRKLTDGSAEAEVEGGSVGEVLQNLGKYSGLTERLLDEKGQVRRYVNLFVNGEDIRHLDNLKTAVKDGDELSIVPAVAGG